MRNTTHRISNDGGNLPSNYWSLCIPSNMILRYSGTWRRVVWWTHINSNASKKPVACISRIEFYLGV